MIHSMHDKKRKILQFIIILVGSCFVCTAGVLHNLPPTALLGCFDSIENPQCVLAAENRSASGLLANGNYAVDVALSGGSGKASVESPTLLTVENGNYTARITWSSSNYDYMVVDGKTYYNQNTDGGNSVFMIPILAFDVETPVIADTVAMGEPHEIPYTLLFYSDSIGSESSLPQEGAKRVLIMAAVIIIAGGILNYFTNKRRKRDYLGAKR